MMLTLCHQLDLLPPITLLLLIDLLGQVHQLGQLDQQVLSLHQLSQGKPLNQWAVLLASLLASGQHQWDPRLSPLHLDFCLEQSFLFYICTRNISRSRPIRSRNRGSSKGGTKERSQLFTLNQLMIQRQSL